MRARGTQCKTEAKAKRGSIKPR